MKYSFHNLLEIMFSEIPQCIIEMYILKEVGFIDAIVESFSIYFNHMKYVN